MPIDSIVAWASWEYQALFIGFKAHSNRCNSYLITLLGQEYVVRQIIGFGHEPTTVMLPNGHNNKLTSIDLLLCQQNN